MGIIALASILIICYLAYGKVNKPNQKDLKK